MEHIEQVRKFIAEALYLEMDEVTAKSSLMKDLGAESIDFLDIVFRLEKAFGVKIPKGEIERQARGGLAEAEFASGGKVQPLGIEALKKALPEVDASLLKDGLTVRDIPSLFTVATFERLVREQLAAQRPLRAAPAPAAAVVAANAKAAASGAAARL
jgi:acyl carrier protein